jgi:hypothetical protein
MSVGYVERIGSCAVVHDRAFAIEIANVVEGYELIIVDCTCWEPWGGEGVLWAIHMTRYSFVPFSAEGRHCFERHA